MNSLVVCAVPREAEAVRGLSNCKVVVSGVGRTNAAIATTRALLQDGPYDAVFSMGIAGSLAGGGFTPDIGDVIVASESVYHEEGLVTSKGFSDTSEMGFPLGSFPGNRVPGSPHLLEILEGLGRPGPVATVATCSGTNVASAEVAHRTGAVAEAMEGAAVLHAASVFGCPALELRVISNTTGDRENQVWRLDDALSILADLVPGLDARLQGR
ncbi:MAG: futalosine hydrolase [Phycisphaerae bacterium]|nr:futalosine hydrolase [Phycisphaerae bacterium]HAW95296.1 futalosine hydrolase [Phycisphaerales bacterium]